MPRNIYDDILSDARVKLTELFGDNFRQQGFFGEKWVATKASKEQTNADAALILSLPGAMRRSIRSMIRGMAVVFTSDRPYTAPATRAAISPLPSAPTRARLEDREHIHRALTHSRQMNMPQRQFIGDHEKVQQALGDIFFQTAAGVLATPCR